MTSTGQPARQPPAEPGDGERPVADPGDEEQTQERPAVRLLVADSAATTAERPTIETITVRPSAPSEPRLEIAIGRFAFWKPDDAKYRTQSTPK